MFSELLSGVFIQGPFVCNALKKLSDERWEKFLGHFSTKGMHCSPILLHSGLRNVEFIKKGEIWSQNIYENLSITTYVTGFFMWKNCYSCKKGDFENRICQFQGF